MTSLVAAIVLVLSAVIIGYRATVLGRLARLRTAVLHHLNMYHDIAQEHGRQQRRLASAIWSALRELKQIKLFADWVRAKDCGTAAEDSLVATESKLLMLDEERLREFLAASPKTAKHSVVHPQLAQLGKLQEALNRAQDAFDEANAAYEVRKTQGIYSLIVWSAGGHATITLQTSSNAGETDA